MVTNERSGGPNLLKMVNQIQHNSLEIATHRLEDRTKNVLKRVRSSVAETQAEGRTNNFSRQPLVMGNDKDMQMDGSEGSDLVEENIRRLPAGGEGWDRKMKRKRSAGTVLTRPMDGDTEPKQHYKLKNEPALQSCDAQGFRSGSSNGSSSITKLDSNSLLPGSNSRVVLKNELEKASFSRDVILGLNKERLLAKGNNKLNMLEDSSIVSPSPVTKVKAPRAQRTGPVMAARSLSNSPRALGATNEGWEQSPIANKVQSMGGDNNRKRPTPMPTQSYSTPMAQWSGQRPQKISRTRRATMVSPVSNHDEVQISSEGCSPPDFGRATCIGTNGPPSAKGVVNGNQQFRVKNEKVSSPTKLSENEESGTVENRERLRGKVIGSCEVEKPLISVQNIGPVLLAKRNKMLNKEELGDGVRRQGRSGRGPSLARDSFPPTGEKLENPASIKPPRSSRPGPDKNGSKSGRPLKKLTDRKAFTHLGQMHGGSSPDTGESDDDREELLAAANFASNASYLACSGSFWKKMEPIFSRASLDDTCYLKQQVGDLVGEESCISQCLVSEGREKGLVDQPGSELPSSVALFEAKCVILDSETRNKIAPLYQRVLSALIVEDEMEGFEDDSEMRNTPFQNGTDDYFGVALVDIGNDTRYGNEAILGVYSQKQSTINTGSCNGSTIISRVTRNQNTLYEDDLFRGDGSYLFSENVMLPEVHRNGVDAACMNACGVSSFDQQYEHMCLEDKLLLELQSVGLSPETVPDLADREEDGISKDIAELQKGLHQQVGKRKAHVNKIIKTIEEGKAMEGRALEKVGLDRLVEVAYRKMLATRGSSAAKAGVPKVSKQVAFAFMKRTLARCRKFEITGKSCFSEPALRDVLHAAPHLSDHADSIPLSRGPQQVLDDLGSTLLGGTKGKRSERERNKKDSQARHSERKTKTKPKQKTAELSTSGNGLVTHPVYPGASSEVVRNKKRENGFTSRNEDPFKEIDCIEEVGVGPQDLSCWLNFDDDDGIQDHDSMGLDIPMDDLADLSMLI